MKKIVLKVFSRPKPVLQRNLDSDEIDSQDDFLETIVICSNFAFPITSVLSESSNINSVIDCDCIVKASLKRNKLAANLTMDGQVFSTFCTLVLLSRNFRVHLLRKVYRQLHSSHFDDSEICSLCYCNIFPCSLQVDIVWPSKVALDYNWNYKVEDLVFEHCELENISAWLSTLGGAFSSLGENSINFAERAQKTSLQQMKIALKRNDPLLMSRCRIYYAMSLIQKNDIRKARKILENEYTFAKSNIGKLDFRLANMCLGVWAKLKYVYQQKQEKGLGTKVR